MSVVNLMDIIEDKDTKEFTGIIKDAFGLKSDSFKNVFYERIRKENNKGISVKDIIHSFSANKLNIIDSVNKNNQFNDGELAAYASLHLACKYIQ